MVFGAQRRVRCGRFANPFLKAACLRIAQLSEIARISGWVPDALAFQRVQASERIAVRYRLRSRIVMAGRPGFVGRTFCVRLSAGTRVFLSIESTIARFGGPTYSPTILQTLRDLEAPPQVRRELAVGRDAMRR